MVINHNLGADWAARNLKSAQALMQASLARLSSGSKLTLPSDDAAGGAVSTRLDAKAVQVEAVRSTITNALSFTQTQSGYLKSAAKLLNRMGELCVLAQDVTKSPEDRAIYDQEYLQSCEAWKDLSSKEFNGRRLFSHINREVLTDTDGTKFDMGGIDLMGMDYMELTSPLTPRMSTGFFTVDGTAVESSPSWPSPRTGLQEAATVLATDLENKFSYDDATGKDTFSLESGHRFSVSGENDTNNCLALTGLSKGTYYARTATRVGWDSSTPVAAAGVKPGDFEVNGFKVTVADGDTIQAVLDKINTATGNAVQAVWQSTGDGGGNLMLKSAHTPVLTDGASEFLTRFGLLASGSHYHTIRSGALAAWSSSSQLAAADIMPGTCTVNGNSVTIGASDTFQDLINKINATSGGKITAKWLESADGGGHLRLEAAADSDVSVSDAGSNVFSKLGLSGAGTAHHVANSGLLAGWKADTTMSQAGVSAGTFQVNGKTVNVLAADTVQDVLDKINAATSGAVNATWNQSGTKGGEVHLDSDSTPTLSTPSGPTGSDFLTKIGLSVGGTGTHVFSIDGTYAGVRTSSVGAAGIGTGSFTVNGSAVTVTASDTVQGVLDKIQNASGGTISASWTARTGGGAEVVMYSTAEPDITGDTSGFLSRMKLDDAGGVTFQHQLTGTQEGGWTTLATNVVSAGFTAGNFKVNGLNIAITESDSVGDVLARIATTTGGAVTARAEAAAGGGVFFRLDSSSPVSLDAGTSNFLSQARLNIWGVEGSKTQTVDSHYEVAIDDVNLRTAITPGTFTINGKQITIGEGESLFSVISKMSFSVVSKDGIHMTQTLASYDWEQDRVAISNETYLMNGQPAVPLPLVLGAPSDTSNLLAACRLKIDGANPHAAESSETISQFLRTPAAAIATLAKVKTALADLTRDASAAATSQARLQVCMDQLAVTHESLNRASSVLEDVDMAEEATQFSRAQILVQSGTAMLAQANLSPQSVMKLLG